MKEVQNMNFGSIIRKLRKDRNLTLSDVSRQSGIQLATLSRIENHKITGSLQSHFGIAKALDLKLSDLIREYESSSA